MPYPLKRSFVITSDGLYMQWPFTVCGLAWLSCDEMKEYIKSTVAYKVNALRVYLSGVKSWSLRGFEPGRGEF